jgi:exo-beta-1,3-glucanase (GH17 family)
MFNQDSQSTVSRSLIAIAVLALGCAVALSWWWARGRDVSLPSITSAGGQRFPCVSYSPFRLPDINPFNYLASVTPAQIETDLTILKSRTDCVRTYGLTQGIDAVPAVARKLGMRVKLGIWLARDAPQNQAQIAKGLSLARLYPDVIELLVVGNEVLLRRELTVKQLGEILMTTRAQSTVPITYADVWEFWQRNAELAQHVDVVTVHILPYWEDHPVAVHEAARHVQTIGNQMQIAFNGKPVWIGETGWPAAGRQRDGAVPGTVEQSQFFRELLLLRPAIAQDFNVIEAFDQPWKRSFEGAMGGYWGLFDAEGRPRVSLTGVMVEDTRWWRGFGAAGLGALIGLISALGAPRRNLKVLSIGVFGGGLIGALLATQLLMHTLWDRSSFETAVSISLALVGTISAVLSLVQLVGFGTAKVAKTKAKLLVSNVPFFADAARLAVLFCAASAALILLLDPRYRPFAWWWFLAPTVSWLALRCGAHQLEYSASRQTKFLATALALSTLGLIVQEGWYNTQALAYGAMCLVLAATAIWPALSVMPRLAKTKAAKSAAGAQSSVE